MGTHFLSDEQGEIFIDHMTPGRYGFVISGKALQWAPIAGRVLIEEGKQAVVKVRIE